YDDRFSWTQTLCHQCGRSTVVAANFEQIADESHCRLIGQEKIEMPTVVDVEPTRDRLDRSEHVANQRSRLADVQEPRRLAKGMWRRRRPIVPNDPLQRRRNQSPQDTRRHECSRDPTQELESRTGNGSKN